jgi:putative alpha-1,2-mannosidase
MKDGRKGWLRPRKPDGSCYEWNLDTSTGNWNQPTYEGNAVEYQFAASFDVQGMICLYGGAQEFIERLDFMFETAFDPGNEPSFLSPFLYIYAGAYSKTVDRVQQILADHYTAAHDGIPGNDDSGAMGSYFVWLSLGLYPSTATEVYLISSPTFKRAAIQLEDNQVLNIVADNLSAERRYIVSASLNGKTLTRAWFYHWEIKSGGELLFEMGDVPTDFGIHDLPPSDTTQCEASD